MAGQGGAGSGCPLVCVRVLWSGGADGRRQGEMWHPDGAAYVPRIFFYDGASKQVSASKGDGRGSGGG